MEVDYELEEAIRRSIADLEKINLEQQAKAVSVDDHPSDHHLDSLIGRFRPTSEDDESDGFYSDQEEPLFADSVRMGSSLSVSSRPSDPVFDVRDDVRPEDFDELIVSPYDELKPNDGFSYVSIERVRCTTPFPSGRDGSRREPPLNRFHSFGMLDDSCETVRLLAGPSFRRFFFNNFSDETRTFIYRNRFGQKKVTLGARQRLQILTEQFSFIETGKPELVQTNLNSPRSFSFVRECPFTYTNEYLHGRFYYTDPFGCQVLVNGLGSPVPSRSYSGNFSSYFNSLPRNLTEIGRTTHFGRAIVFSMLMMVAFALCGPGEIERCGTCLLPSLSACTGSFQCDSGVCLLGICSVGQASCPSRPTCGSRFCSDSSNTCCTSQPNCPGDHVCVKDPGSPAGICKKNLGSSCSDDSDCASQQCPPGGGVCSGTNLGTSTRYCCDTNGFASLCPSSTPTTTVSLSSTPTPSISGPVSFTPTPSHSSHATPLQTVIPTPEMTQSSSPRPVTTPEPSGSCSHCVIQTRNVPFDVDNVSSSSRLQPGFPFSLFVKGAEAATPCRNGKFLINLAEKQKPGSSITSNCTEAGCPYTFDRDTRYGVFEPNFETFDLCPDPVNRGVSLVRSGREVLARDEVVTVDLEDSMFTLTFSSGDAPRVVAIQLSGETYTTTCYASVCFIVVSPELLYHSSRSTVTVIENGEVVADKVIQIVGQRQCYVKDCWTCNLSNWSCVPKIIKALLVIIIILSCVVILYLFFKVGILTFACLALAGRGLFVCLSGFIRIGNNKVRDMSEWFEAAQVRRAARVATVALLFMGVSCCDNSTVIATSLESCSFSGSEEVCALSFDSVVSLRGPGSTACLVFKKDEAVFAQLELSLTTNQITCDLVDPYFTSDFDIYSKSIFHCQGGFGSNCTSDCSSTSLRTGSSYFDVSRDLLNFPGRTTCNRQCSGIGCGCVLPTLGCVYTTYSIVPHSSLMRVSRPVNCQFSPVVSYKLVDSNSKTTSGSFSYEGGYVFDENLQLQIITSLEKELPSDLPSHICEGTRSGFCEASYLNSPRASTIGDIQSLNQTGLNNGQFIASSEIYIGLNHQNTYNKVVTKSPGYNTDFKALPSFQSGLVWSLDSSGPGFASKLFSYDDRPSPILVSVQSQNNLTVSRTVTKVCPEFEYLNSTGCHDCSAGYSACFTFKSSCFEGTSLFQSQNIAPQLIKLTKVSRPVCLQGFTKNKSGKDNFKIGDSEGSYSYELEEGLQLGQETILFTGEKVPAHVSFRKGSWKWWEYLIASVLMLLSLLFILGILFLIGPAILSGLGALISYFRIRRSKEKVLPRQKETEEVILKERPVYRNLSRRTGF